MDCPTPPCQQPSNQASRQAKSGQCHSLPLPSLPFPCSLFLSLAFYLDFCRQGDKGRGWAGAGGQERWGRESTAMPFAPPFLLALPFLSL